MLNALLSIIHVDLLLWCEAALIGILLIGAFLTSLGTSMKKMTIASGVLQSALPVILFIAALRVLRSLDVDAEQFFQYFGILLLLSAITGFIWKTSRKSTLELSRLQHIGLVAFMIGAGPAGAIPAMIHLFGQAIGHSALWYAMQRKESIAAHRGIRFSVIALIAAMFGAPFSMLFVSELVGIGYALQAHTALALGVFAAVVVMNILVMRRVLNFFAEPRSESVLPMTKNEKVFTGVLAAHAVILFGAGTYLLTQPGIQFAVTVAQNIAAL